MNTETTLPSLGILTEVLEPEGLMESPQFAREVLSLHLKEGAKDRIRELLQKKNAGTITPAEQSTLEEYILAGEFLDLLHVKARRALRQNGLPAP